MQHQVINNESESRFEIKTNEYTSLLDYKLRDNTLLLLHTEVPDALEGKGLASSLAMHALEYARTNGFKVKVYCAFVKVYLERHKEYADLVV